MTYKGIDECRAVMLTTGADNFTGTAGNDTFNGLSSSVAGESTINAADKIDGGAGKDTLNIAVTGTATATTNGADIKNIESALQNALKPHGH